MDDEARTTRPAQGPQTPVLIFDGACGFCTAAIQWLERRLERRVRLLPFKEAPAGAFGVGARDAERTVWWIEPPDRRAHSEQAVALALLSCRPPWPWLGRLLRVPGVRGLARLGYRLVARHRHRLPGTTPATEASRSDSSAPPGARVTPPSRGPG